MKKRLPRISAPLLGYFRHYIIIKKCLDPNKRAPDEGVELISAPALIWVNTVHKKTHLMYKKLILEGRYRRRERRRREIKRNGRREGGGGGGGWGEGRYVSQIKKHV